MTPTIRTERAGDEAAVRALTEAAFRGQPHSDGSEAAIIDRLRGAGDLTLSLVAELAGEPVGHVAFSPVEISDSTTGWYGLGPLSVRPALQGKGIGSRLVERGIADLSAIGAGGVVLLGDPAYYRRFGFACDPALVYPGPSPEYFQRLVLAGPAPRGTVRYSDAFG